jgi:cytochrome P450
LLGIYLNDHLAGTTGIVELARRAAASQRGTETGEVLQQLAAELTAGRAALRTMMATLGVPERQYKTWAAWLAEKAGRLKLNGSLLERSPLSSVLELEMLRLGMEATGAAWHTLSELAERDERLNKTQLTDLLARAKQQSQTLEELRIRAASRAFSGPTGQ